MSKQQASRNQSQLLKEEKELLNCIKAGEEQAFEYIFHTYYASLCLYACKMVSDTDKARELCQEVFVKLYENRLQITITASVKSYLFTCVHNSCINYLKQVQIHNKHHVHVHHAAVASYEHNSLLDKELEERLLLAIAKLPQQCRKIFTMNRFEGKKNKDIALELGISIRTVETQISKALHILRSELADLFTVLLPLLSVFL